LEKKANASSSVSTNYLISDDENTNTGGRRMIQEQLPDFQHLAYMLAAPPPLESCTAQDNVALTGRSTDKVVLHARMSCQGMVILSDVFFPGWRAEVDGHVTPIYEVNKAMRGVIVTRGDHIITIRYQPASALAGGLLSLIGVAGAISWGRLSAFRRRSTGRTRIPQSVASHG
jgi:hypothetical protein